MMEGWTEFFLGCRQDYIYFLIGVAVLYLIYLLVKALKNIE